MRHIFFKLRPFDNAIRFDQIHIMMDPYFFGYGSLVNAQTHSYCDTRPATLRGWRRVWRRTDYRDQCFLTIVPCEKTQLLGLIAKVPDADWAALDAREFGYDRLHATGQVEHDHHPDLQVAIYSIPQNTTDTPNRDHPILLSYLDVVLQGYMRVFGDTGAQHFMETTDGWDTPILDDRSAPQYPRAQLLTEKETALVNEHIRAVGGMVFKP